MKTGIIILVVIILIILGFVFFGGQGTDVVEDDLVDTTTEEQVQFTATVRNVHDTQPLSPGVFVIHDHDVSFNWEGGLSPDEFEPLAEYGSNEAFVEYVRGLDGVVGVIPIDAPILPGEEASFGFSADEDELADLHLSGLQMLVATNDGYALVDSVELADVSETPVVVEAANYDNGTEENEAPGGGFEAGQPDKSRGEENVENGTPTDPQEPVALHEQITETALELTVVQG